MGYYGVIPSIRASQSLGELIRQENVSHDEIVREREKRRYAAKKHRGAAGTDNDRRRGPHSRVYSYKRSSTSTTKPGLSAKCAMGKHKPCTKLNCTCPCHVKEDA